MEVEERVSADYMVAAFLRSEIDSPRNGRFVSEHLTASGQNRTLVDNADVENDTENALRALVLKSRGYPDEFLFAGLPADIVWHAARATRDEIPAFRYGAEATYPGWWSLSSGTGVVADGAAGVDLVEVDQNINQQIRDDADAIRNGADRGPLIVVSTTIDDTMVLLDGCCRATAYARVGGDGPPNVSVIVGLSEHMAQWAHWPF